MVGAIAMLARSSIVADILWIKAGRSYYEIQTSEKLHTMSGNLNIFNRRLTHPLLVRIHRSYIVNIDKVTGIKGYTLIMGEHEVPWSETYRHVIASRLQMISTFGKQ